MTTLGLDFGLGNMQRRTAVLSECKLYRYLLSDPLTGSGPPILWVMLNPSTADDKKNDPTMCRCIEFSTAWGAGLLEVVNLAAWRSPQPKDLRTARIPIGRENDFHIRSAALRTVAAGGRVVVAWGCSVAFDDSAPYGMHARDDEVLRMLSGIGDVYCLGKTKSGAPIHPAARGKSRIPKGTMPQMFAAKGSVR